MLFVFVVEYCFYLFACLFVCVFFFMRLYFVEHNETLKSNFN